MRPILSGDRGRVPTEQDAILRGFTLRFPQWITLLEFSAGTDPFFFDIRKKGHEFRYTFEYSRVKHRPTRKGQTRHGRTRRQY